MVLDGFVAQFLGSITQCALFAHTLRDTIVLGPHQTWPWMAHGKRKGIKPGSELSRDGELYAFLRHYRLGRWQLAVANQAVIQAPSLRRPANEPARLSSGLYRAVIRTAQGARHDTRRAFRSVIRA